MMSFFPSSSYLFGRMRRRREGIQKVTISSSSLSSPHSTPRTRSHRVRGRVFASSIRVVRSSLGGRARTSSRLREEGGGEEIGVDELASEDEGGKHFRKEERESSSGFYRISKTSRRICTHESSKQRDHILRSLESDVLVKKRTSEEEEGSRDERPFCERRDVRVSDDLVNDFNGQGRKEGGVRHGLGTKRRKSKGSRCWESEARKEGEVEGEVDERRALVTVELDDAL